MKAKRIVSATVLTAVLPIMFNTLVGCVATEQLSEAPHINLSPETMNVIAKNTQGSADIGLSVAANESDSLDNLEVLPGVRIKRVAANSLAERAAMRSGDVILSVNGVDTNDTDTLNTLLAAETAFFEFDIRRDTQVFATTVLVQADAINRQVVEKYRIDPVKLRAGFSTIVIAEGQQPSHQSSQESSQQSSSQSSTQQPTKFQSAIRVEKIFPQSPLLLADVKVGDIIVALNGDNISSAQAFVNAITTQHNYGDEVQLVVIDESAQEKKSKQVTLEIWQPERRLSGVQFWPLFTYRSTLDPRYMRWSVLDFWLFSLFAYERELDEKTVSFFTVIKYSTDYGDLSEAKESVE